VNSRAAVLALAATSALAAGCGSSTKTTSSTSSASPAAATTAKSGPYGASAATTTSAASTQAAVEITTKSNKLGTVLAAGPKKLTVYLFEGDKGGKPTCSGSCASVWPPVPAGGGSPHASGGLQASLVGSVTRPDGSRQLTYAGHPLYYYTRDGDSGDAYGQGVNGFGALWYALTPSGTAVKSSGSSGSGSSTGSGSSSSSSSTESSGGGKGYAY
jgi:predicted lipoprotein with Yx(FWY)xxD motif